MLSQRDALGEPYGLGGFTHRTVQSMARCSAWESMYGNNGITYKEAVPVVIDLTRMGDLCFMCIAGCLGGVDVTKDPSTGSTITIDYKLPYTFIGRNGEDLSFIIPMVMHSDCGGYEGRARMTISGKTRLITISAWENGNPDGGFSHTGRKSDYSCWQGNDNIMVWWNVNVLPANRTHGFRQGAYINKDEETKVQQNLFYEPDFPTYTKTYGFTNSKGMEEEVTVSTDENGVPDEFYGMTPLVKTDKDADYKFVYDENTKQVEQITLCDELENAIIYHTEKTNTHYVKIGDQLCKVMHSGPIDIKDQSENMIYGLCEDKYSTNLNMWLFQHKKKIYQIKAINFADDKSWYTITINDGTTDSTYKIDTESMSFNLV